MHIQVILYVLFIDFLAILSPGPDFFMVLKNAMTHSHKAGIYTALGIATGSILVFAIGLFGIGAVVASSKWLFWFLKIAGSLYLIYLALKSIFAKTKIEEPQLVYASKDVLPSVQFYKIGLLCNLTNPKSFMFVVSLSTYAVAHGASDILDIVAILIGNGISTVLWFGAVAVIFGNFKVRKIFYQQQRVINLLFGGILLYVAAMIIFM
ncbi:MAG: lysine exporter family protein [Burkholderiales bacterium]|jgi:threonine/homoserine/homoserine lactone efflux protein|nr:lysine exporter family protein [Burkholderiales bacterium]